ncbi:hypothetical protein B0J14DRAFT_558046 [Halenospora varia]|nr:hypothetical protein B0J14DRAFT_558046 [Halenospora varia]
MAPKTLGFKCALITGGGGRIGRAMAEYLISIGKKTIIVGRTEKTLARTAKELGNNTTYYVLDTGDIPSIEPFVKKLIREHPQVDCLINNAAVQSVQEINSFDLSKADTELNINIRGPLHLAMLQLPHLRTHLSSTVINASSLLGFIPIINYQSSIQCDKSMDA